MEQVVEQKKGSVLLVEINHPATHNAISNLILKEISEIFERAESDLAVKVLIVAGKGKNFAAGADVNDLKKHNRDSIKTDVRKTYWKNISSFSKPYIAAVNGYCLGAGMELAARADIIVAGEKAVFGQPEINLGIMPGAGGVQFLLHYLGKSNAMKLLYSGEFLPVVEAYRLGMVATVTHEDILLKTALELGERISQKSLLALKAIKETMNQFYQKDGSLNSLEGSFSLLEKERNLYEKLFSYHDPQEGMQAFLEKRRPNFKDQ